MKTKLLMALTLLVISACTIQKRHHRSGYHIEWKKNYSAANKEKKAEKAKDDYAYSKAFDKANKGEATTIQNNATSKASKTFEPKTNAIASNKQRVNAQTPSKVVTNNRNVTEVLNSSKTTSIEEVVAKKASYKEHERKSGDQLILYTSVVMALSTMFGLRLGRRGFRKVTRWASKNPKKTQYLMAGIQIPLMGMSIYGGYNLYKMGYDLSDTQMLISASVVGLGIATIPFLPNKGELVLPKRLNRRRAAFLGAMVASTMMLVNYGNNIGSHDDASYTKQTLAYVDNAVMGSDQATSVHSQANYTVQSNLEQEETASKSKLRQAASVGLCLAAILLYILLICTFCAGVCMAVFGIAGAAGMAGNIGLVVGGIAIAVLSVMAMAAIGRSGWCRQRSN